MKSRKQPRKKPMSSAEIAEHIAGSKQHILDAAVRRAVREAIELNEFLDAQKKRRELEPPPRPVNYKRRAS